MIFSWDNITVQAKVAAPGEAGAGGGGGARGFFRRNKGGGERKKFTLMLLSLLALMLLSLLALMLLLLLLLLLLLSSAIFATIYFRSLGVFSMLVKMFKLYFIFPFPQAPRSPRPSSRALAATSDRGSWWP